MEKGHVSKESPPRRALGQAGVGNVPVWPSWTFSCITSANLLAADSGVEGSDAHLPFSKTRRPMAGSGSLYGCDSEELAGLLPGVQQAEAEQQAVMG
jgi:hypothetical protein